MSPYRPYGTSRQLRILIQLNQRKLSLPYLSNQYIWLNSGGLLCLPLPSFLSHNPGYALFNPSASELLTLSPQVSYWVMGKQWQYLHRQEVNFTELHCSHKLLKLQTCYGLSHPIFSDSVTSMSPSSDDLLQEVNLSNPKATDKQTYWSPFHEFQLYNIVFCPQNPRFHFVCKYYVTQLSLIDFQQSGSESFPASPSLLVKASIRLSDCQPCYQQQGHD